MKGLGRIGRAECLPDTFNPLEFPGRASVEMLNPPVQNYNKEYICKCAVPNSNTRLNKQICEGAAPI